MKYGYLSSTHTFTDMNEAIRKFQKFAHIPDTGILDDITVTMMQMPRCGVKDFAPNEGRRAKRFVASSSYWLNRTVTFAFENYNSDLGMVKTRQIIKAAFKTWSDVTNLVFKEVSGTKATIMIRYILLFPLFVSFHLILVHVMLFCLKVTTDQATGWY